MELSEGEGRSGAGAAEAQADVFVQGAQARWQFLLLASIPKGYKGTLLAGKQPPLAPLQGHQGGASFPRPTTHGHLPRQAKCITGLTRQACGIACSWWPASGGNGLAAALLALGVAGESTSGQAGGRRRRQACETVQRNRGQGASRAPAWSRAAPTQQGGRVLFCQHGPASSAAIAARLGQGHQEQHLANQGGQQGRCPAPNQRLSQLWV